MCRELAQRLASGEPIAGTEPGTALFSTDATALHPQLGSGAVFFLKLRAAGGAELAVRLNAAERHGWTRSHFLGGWGLGAELESGDPAVTFWTFLPIAA